MRIHRVIVAILIGLALSALWLRRSPQRDGASSQKVASPRDDTRFVNAWQSDVKLDKNAQYDPDQAKRRQLAEKLRQEEARQRPQKGRN